MLEVVVEIEAAPAAVYDDLVALTGLIVRVLHQHGKTEGMRLTTARDPILEFHLRVDSKDHPAGFVLVADQLFNAFQREPALLHLNRCRFRVSARSLEFCEFENDGRRYE